MFRMLMETDPASQRQARPGKFQSFLAMTNSMPLVSNDRGLIPERFDVRTPFEARRHFAALTPNRR